MVQTQIRHGVRGTVAVFLPNWIGDAAMATPALRSLAASRSDRGHLIGILRPYIREVLAGTEWLDEFIEYEPNRAGRRRLTATLRARSIDTALLLTNSFSTAWIAWRGGIRRRIGYRGDGRAWLLTDPLTRVRHRGRRLPRSAVDDYLDLVRVLGIVPDTPRLELHVTPEERQRGAAIWSQLGLGTRPVIAFHPGAAYGSAKCWPPDAFARLADQLVEQLDTDILVLCGPGERDIARTIERSASTDHIVSLAEAGLSIGQTKALLQQCRMLVTTDSGPRHLAAGLGIPTVALFGSTDPRWSGNYHPLERRLEIELDCRPCGRRACPLQHHRCMTELHPELVADAVAAWWQEPGSVPCGHSTWPRPASTRLAG